MERDPLKMARDCMVGVGRCSMKGHKEQGMYRMPLKMELGIFQQRRKKQDTCWHTDEQKGL